MGRLSFLAAKRMYRISIIPIVSILVVCLTGSLRCQQLEKSGFGVEEIFAEGDLTGNEPESVQWRPDGKGLSFLLRERPRGSMQLWFVDAQSGEKHLLVDRAELEKLVVLSSSTKDERERERITRYSVAAYHWSPDSQHLLFDANGQSWLYTIETHQSEQLKFGVSPAKNLQFSPDGKRVAYVHDRNLYVTSLNTRTERQITKSGDRNLLNGDVDSLYEEQLDLHSGYSWSPSGKEIAFLQLDENHVPTYPITDWMPLHPKVEFQKYPKAGDPNPVVRLGVVDARGGEPRFFPVAKGRDVYIPRFGWVRDGILWIEVLDRRQENLDLYFMESASGKWRKMLSETALDTWINVADGFLTLKSQDGFVWSSWRDGTTQLYTYVFDRVHPLRAKARFAGQLTRGDFEVLKIEGQSREGIVYFTCDKNDPRQRQLYSVKLQGTDLQQITPDEGTHTVALSPDGQHYSDTFSGTLAPPRLSVCVLSGECRE